MSYGDKFTPAGASDEVKVRGPVWVGVFTLLTLGIYSIYWVFQTAKHLKEYGNAKGRDLGQSPGMTLLAITLGWLIIVPPFVALFRQAKRIQQAQHLAGISQPMNGWIALVLYLVLSPVFFAYEQSELNKAWASEGGPVPSSDGYEAPRLESTPADDPLTTTTPTTSSSEMSSPERPGQ
jgi:hypothetical protein